jgi:hypothetical protein
MAPARRTAAFLWDLWRQAAEIRREWLEIGLSTEPADRQAAEAAITSIYARHHRARPAFVWVASPGAALPLLTGLPTHETLRSWVGDRPPPGKPPIAVDIAAGLSHLRSTLADDYIEPSRERPPMKRKKGDPWPRMRPSDALDAGLPFQELLRQGIRESLFQSLAHGVYLPLRSALGGTSTVPVGWYGNQDAAWVGHFDVLRRVGLAHYREESRFATWVDLTRAAGWWWPAEDHCILVDRPSVIRTEPTPHQWHDEIRLCPDTTKPAIEYRDGWST